MNATDVEKWKNDRAARDLEEQREVTRARWLDGIRTAMECVVSCAVGLFFVGLAAHVTDYRLGMVYFWSGLILGYSGMIASLSGFYRRGEARGQW